MKHCLEYVSKWSWQFCCRCCRRKKSITIGSAYQRLSCDELCFAKKNKGCIFAITEKIEQFRIDSWLREKQQTPLSQLGQLHTYSVKGIAIYLKGITAMKSIKERISVVLILNGNWLFKNYTYFTFFTSCFTISRSPTTNHFLLTYLKSQIDIYLQLKRSIGKIVVRTAETLFLWEIYIRRAC